MSKINVKVYRKDWAADADHSHKLEDGSFTGGALYKPNARRDFPHTHLYQHDGKTLETGISLSEPGHTHDYKTENVVGFNAETAGPSPVDKGRGAEIPREAK